MIINHMISADPVRLHYLWKAPNEFYALQMSDCGWNGREGCPISEGLLVKFPLHASLLCPLARRFTHTALL